MSKAYSSINQITRTGAKKPKIQNGRIANQCVSSPRADSTKNRFKFSSVKLSSLFFLKPRFFQTMPPSGNRCFQRLTLKIRSYSCPPFSNRRARKKKPSGKKWRSGICMQIKAAPTCKTGHRRKHKMIANASGRKITCISLSLSYCSPFPRCFQSENFLER